MWTYFLYKQIVFQHFSGFHNSYNGCLDVHLPVLIHSTPSLFYFLHKQNTTHFISISLHYSYIILLLHGQSHPLCLLFSSVTSTYLCLNIFFLFLFKTYNKHIKLFLFFQQSTPVQFMSFFRIFSSVTSSNYCLNIFSLNYMLFSKAQLWKTTKKCLLISLEHLLSCINFLYYNYVK